MIDYVDFAELPSLKSQWEAIFSAGGQANPFLSWDWVYWWGSQFDGDTDAIVAIAREGLDLNALACFRKARNVFRFHANKAYADYVGALCRPGRESDLAAIFRDVDRRFSPRMFSLGPVRAIDPVASVLDRHFSSSSKRWRRDEVTVNPVVRIGAGFDEYYKSRDKGLRQEIRTTENRLRKMGGWQFAIGETKTERDEMFSRLVEFQLGRQERKAGMSVLADPAGQQFFRALLHRDGVNFSAQISALRIGSRTISTAYSLRCGDSFYYWIPSFDSTIRSVSLGKLHIKCLIEYCHQNGLKRFDFMGGDEPYKFQWANDSFPLFCYRSFRNPLMADAFAFAIRSRARLRTLSRQSGAATAIWRKISKLLR
jgi:CelD/BcsL family acetyltransferase involved in cellulose biosynthesis